MNYVLATGRRELAVVLGLGLCFGFALFAHWLGLSVAAGGFVAGALIAEAKRSEVLAHTMAPIRDMFAAVFFVAIGMLLDPALLARYWPHVLLVTTVLIAGKIVAGSVATFLLGYDRGTAIRIGMSLAQIGEFSLVLVKIGHDSGLVGPFLYPVIVGAVGLSTLTTPYLISRSAAAGEKLDQALSPRLRRYLQSMEAALQRLQLQVSEPGLYRTALRHNIQGILVNLFLFLIAVVLGRLAHDHFETIASFLGLSSEAMVLLVGVGTLALAAFPLVAIIHYVRRLAVIGAMAVVSKKNSSPVLSRPVVRVLFRNSVTIILLLAMVMMVNLLLPTFPGVPYLPWFIMGASLLVLIYLFWRILGVLHRRVERLIGKHLDDDKHPHQNE